MAGELSRLEITNYSVESRDDSKFIITGQVMSSDLIPLDILQEYLPRLKGKELRLEHRIPEQDPFAVVGEVINVFFDPETGEPFASSEVWARSPIEKELRKDLIRDQKLPVNKRKYKGFSIGILKERNVKTKKITWIFPRELTITREPICGKCSIDNVTQQTELMVGQYGMSEQNISRFMDEQRKSFDSQMERQESHYSKLLSIKDDEIERMTKEFSRLQGELDASTELFKEKIAEKSKEIENLNKELSESKAKAEKYEEAQKTLDEMKAKEDLEKKTEMVDMIVESVGFSRGIKVTDEMKKEMMGWDTAILMQNLELWGRKVEQNSQATPQYGNVFPSLAIEPRPGSFNLDNIEVSVDIKDVAKREGR